MKNQFIKNTVRRMSLEQKIGALLPLGFEGIITTGSMMMGGVSIN